MYRYIFRNAQKVGLQELGPRLTLKLRSIQKGTFDSKYGEYIWVHKVRHDCVFEEEMESRREGSVCGEQGVGGRGNRWMLTLLCLFF